MTILTVCSDHEDGVTASNCIGSISLKIYFVKKEASLEENNIIPPNHHGIESMFSIADVKESSKKLGAHRTK